MKKINTVLLLSALSLSLIACSSSGTPEISHKAINIHSKNSQTIAREFYFFNKNLDIPYLEIKDTINTFFDSSYYTILQNGTVFTIKNTQTDTNMTLNVDGNVSYEDFTRFQSHQYHQDGCYIDEFRSQILLNRKISEKSTYSKASEYKVDLSKFGLKPTLYEGKYYLPINILHTLLSPCETTFYYDANGEIYIYGKNSDTLSQISKKTSYTKEFYEYCFNQFSLSAELYFGLKGYSRTLRCNSKELKYMPNGVINTFSPYKEKIINSKDIIEFDNNFITMFNETMTDGGHTCGNKYSIGADPKKDLPNSEENNYLNKFNEDGLKKRKAANKSELFDYISSSFDTDEDGKFDIGYVTFDEFLEEKEPSNNNPTITEVFRGNEGANQTFNKYADGYDTASYDIKDVVIDLSCNGGGNVAAEGYLLSWICGGIAQETLKGTNGNIISTYTHNFDVNGDSNFDHKDYLGDDVNVYVLMSPYTYSAANSLAYNAYLYNRQAAQTRKIKFMGMQSGGGACSVVESNYLPTGLSYRLAFNNVSVDISNTSVSCENGVKPDEGLELSFDNIFNRTGANGINQLIVSKRNK